MTALFSRLRAALGERYRLERELGHGGMAHVFRAEDLRHQRRVAIKVLRPELAVALGADRFLREIQIAANLAHPHILPLYDSGGAGGLLYYVMPYVEGETLRELLDREGQLSLEDALRITREVADALGYAHSVGVVHRDIKPENILFQAGHAVVSDFGIARAVTAAGGEKLTETGIAIGTPAYMSPEQATGEAHLDGRADLYGLACVLYEMLAGHPPFTGATVREVLARHATDEVPRLKAARAAVPDSVDRAITRALAKAPADRFATAHQFVEALTAAPAALAPPRLAQLGRRVAAAALGLAVLGLGAAAAIRWWPRGAPRLDPDLIAVLPFRVSGADPSLAYLREGMVDLLAAKLTGEGGPRAADPGVVMRALQGKAEAGDGVQLAERLGAGRALTGSIVGTTRRVVVSASVVEVPSGRVRATAEVSGPADSLLDRIDGLTALLLLRQAGEAEDRLASVTTTSLPALRAYLEGRAAYRRGQWDPAIRHFERALEQDSTFALAAIGVHSAAAWTGYPPQVEKGTRALRIAWAGRDRMSMRDHAVLTGLAGPRYPAPSFEAERLAAWEQAVRLAPDDPEAWFHLGDQYFHWGAMLGVDGYRERAVAAFRQALNLDSTVGGSEVEPLAHLLQIAALDGDSATVRRLSHLVPSTSSFAVGVSWQAALALGDTEMLADAQRRFGELTTQQLRNAIAIAQHDGIGMEDTERMMALMRGQARTREEQDIFLYDSWWFFLNRGRPAAAATARGVVPPVPVVLSALYWDGDRAAAAEVVGRVAPSVDAPLAEDVEERARQYRRLCVVEQWRVAHAATGTVRQAIGRLRAAAPPRDSAVTVVANTLCAVLLDALLAATERTPDAEAALDRLDSLMAAGPPLALSMDWFGYGNLVVARLREGRGDLVRALRAVRRRTPYQFAPAYLSSYLREEGRLAALTGDRDGAIKAYRHYLALRSDPEPALKPEVERVRAELARLVGANRR